MIQNYLIFFLSSSVEKHFLTPIPLLRYYDIVSCALIEMKDLGGLGIKFNSNKDFN